MIQMRNIDDAAVMSNKIKRKSEMAVPLTERQKRIKELQEKLNQPDPAAVHPFTVYKLLTYLCVLILPLTPLALFRIWRPHTEFTRKEQWIWTVLLAAIAVYAAVIAVRY